MATLALLNLCKTFAGEHPAVRHLSLSVREGELLAIVGPSGSGKSTTLRLIAGLEHPSEGEIRIGGRLVNHLPPHKRDVAMVFQSYTLYPHMTVQQNLSFGIGRGVGRAETRKRIAASAEVLKISHLLGRYPGELSGGERQRAALAKAMVRRPAVFLFDEPLSNLDLRLRHEARAQIKALHQRLGTTTIHVTHDQEEAMMLGGRIAVLDRGALQQVGTPTQVYRSPANAFVAGFIGSPAMNFIPGALHASGDDFAFVEDYANGPSPVSLRLPLIAQDGRALAAAGVEKLLLGFRPQALRRCDSGTAGAIKLTVALVEPLGDWVDLTCTFASGNAIVARLPAEQSEDPGRHLALQLEPTDLHFFAPGERGRNLLTRSLTPSPGT